jgi:acyl-CoA oxidase
MDSRQRSLVANASEIILQSYTDPKDDARDERAKATFNSDELAAFMNGGADRLEQKERLTKLLLSQPWGDKSSRYFLTRDQEYVQGLQAAVGIW